MRSLEMMLRLRSRPPAPLPQAHTAKHSLQCTVQGREIRVVHEVNVAVHTAGLTRRLETVLSTNHLRTHPRILCNAQVFFRKEISAEHVS